MRALTILGLFMMVGRGASAAPVSSADALLERGIELRAKGKPADALELFRQANGQSSSARATAQEGLAEVSLRRWLDAHEHLRAALARHDSEWIESPKTRQVLDKTLGEVDAHLGRLRVQGTVGAEVFVAGKSVGLVPLAEPVYVNPGPVKIRSTAAGRAGMEKEVVAVAGDEVGVNLVLDPLPLEVLPPPTAAPMVSFTMPPEAPRWRKWTGVGLIAAGAAAITTGIVWVEVNDKGTGSCGSTGVCPQKYDTGLQGWIAIGVGAAASAGGAGVLLWKGHRQEVGVAVGPGMAAISGQF